MESDGSQADNFFHIRISNQPRLERYQTFARERFSEFIIAYEDQDGDVPRPHIHIHGQAFLKFKNTKQFRREFKDKWFTFLNGNSDYTMKGPDSNPQPNLGGYKYVCKGTSSNWDTGKPEILATTFSEDEIKEFHRQYWNHQERIVVDQQTHPELLDVPVKKREYKSWTQKNIEIWDEIHKDDPPYEGTDAQRLELTQFILTRMGKAGRALDDVIFLRIFRAFENGITDVEYEWYTKHLHHYFYLT